MTPVRPRDRSIAARSASTARRRPFLPDAFGSPSGRAINSDGVVVGYAATMDPAEAFRYDGMHRLFWDARRTEQLRVRHQRRWGHRRRLRSSPAGTACLPLPERHHDRYPHVRQRHLEAVDINASGDRDRHPFARRPDVPRVCVRRDDDHRPRDAWRRFHVPSTLNESGVIVGTSSTATRPNHAFRYAGGTMTSVAPPGSISSEGIAINESGAIAGSYQEADGDRRAFRLEGRNLRPHPGIRRHFATSTDINEAGPGRRLFDDRAEHRHPRVPLRRQRPGRPEPAPATRV